MTDVAFASLPSWWLTAAIVLAVAAAVVLAYRRPIVPLSRPKLATLVMLRAAALAALLAFVMRPVARLSPPQGSRTIVPVLVDVSRSMRVPDAGGLTRMAQANAIAQFDLLPALSQKYEAVRVDVGDASKSDLIGALNRVRERFRGQHVAGIVLLSDGADT